MYKFSLSLLLFWTALFVGIIADIYLAEKILGIANWPIEGKKNNILHYFVHSEENGGRIKRAS